MNFPINFQRVLSDDLFVDVSEELDTGWQLTNHAIDGDTLFWTQTENNLPTYFRAASVVKLKVMRHLQTHVNLLRIQTNGQTSSQESSFHIDFDEDGIWTFILFGSRLWNSDWGGEFVCQIPSTRQLHYTPYVPNEGVLIPSNWWHKGCAPNHRTKNIRTSLALSFATDEVLEEVRDEYDFVARYR